MIKMAREKVYNMDENDHNDDDQITKNNISRINSFEKFSSDVYISPDTPTSVLSELARDDFNEANKKVARVSGSASPLLFSLRVQALGKLNPIDVVNKHLWLHYSQNTLGFDNNSTILGQKNSQNLDMNQTILLDDGDNISNMALEKDSSKGLLVTKSKWSSPLLEHPKTILSKAVLEQPPTPLLPSKGGEPAPSPPPKAIGNIRGGPPPPPPPFGAKISLRPKKTDSKLKRSTQIGNLYRRLKSKVEGTNNNPNGRKNNGIRSGTNGGKQGMADALAEITKRSAYFRKIEEDVEKYTNPILELKSSISCFETKDKDKLLKFHKNVELVLENLTDETQVLSRFEGFPIKKLETLRISSSLYIKFDNIINELRNWKIESPMGQLLDKLDRYFDKIKGEVETLERTKEEESVKFKTHNVHFDFNILITIKESMVDVSSSCMELALKERREAYNKVGEENKRTSERMKSNSKLLWRAFEFAFRVYTFAGGHDDRANKLTIELAQQIDHYDH
ncbi:uncharacterized protein At4g04980-like [Cannabis sativa]|uniref:uncharacterized protein At4g04980-like n=1 Tax=Cannabis sativa TaxID=3483 RepID=UPI0029CA7998|nr:uncharacterized protein At4g04980-like [Cannabis sativa]